jgi:hypothetical protein
VAKDDLADLRLDLAPKLNRPLSLWNPFDYLRLLFWVFYFPQALRWYIDKFGTEDSLGNDIRLSKGIENILSNKIQRKLLIQGSLLAGFLPLFVRLLLQPLLIPAEGAAVNWESMIFVFFICVAISIIFGVASGMAFTIIFFATTSMALNILNAVTFFAANLLSIDPRLFEGEESILIEAFGTKFVLAIVLATGVSIIMALVMAIVTATLVARGMVFKLPATEAGSEFLAWLSLILVAAISVSIAMALIQSLNALTGVTAVTVIISIAISVMALSFGILRPDGWALALILQSLISKNLLFSIASTTLLPLPATTTLLRKTFIEEWSIAVHNSIEILTYTRQSISVARVFDRELAKFPHESTLSRMSELDQSLFDGQIVKLCAVSAINISKVRLMGGFGVLPFKKNLSDSFEFSPHLNIPARAAAAGFWYLHEEKPSKSARAFAVVRDIRHGEEMHGLASLLAMFDAAETAEQIAAIDIPEFPADRTLRPQTWEAIQHFCHAISDTKTVHYSTSRSARAFASNRALGELQTILEHETDLPEAERSLVIKIAQTWQEALLEITAEVGEAAITQPVQNPYVIGDPVEGALFVGRDDIMRQLQELWLMGTHLQSVVIYGHRRMGKTSILKNVAQVLGAGLRVAYVNLLKSAGADNLSDVLLSISDQVAATLAIPPPSDAEMTISPARTFERFLQRATNGLAEGEGLIIALDEFEKIEELIRAGTLETSFWDYLRGLVQDSSKVGYALAGLHSLEEMSSDYSKPFFASLINIKVDFFKQATVQTLLPNPGGDFPLDYDRDALDLIYGLTAGQPYLTQLLGFQLVRRYNDQVFEQQRQREAKFTVSDVQSVVEQPEFFAQGKPYFAGVWAQASHDTPGQQALLQALAPHPEGLAIDNLQHAGLAPSTFSKALETLENHDVVRVSDGVAQIIVEVFRRWVEQQS